MACITNPDDADTSVGAARPDRRRHCCLAQLCRASAKRGTWDVYAFFPTEHAFEYRWQGRTCYGKLFFVTLVSAYDPTMYCRANLRLTARNRDDYHRTKKAILHGKRFIMSNVSLMENLRRETNSSPLQVVVDLSLTTMDIVTDAPCRALEPCPRTDIASTQYLSNRQDFDVTANVKDVGDIQRSHNNVCNFEIKCFDGSVHPETQTRMLMCLRIYFQDTAAQNTQDDSHKSNFPWQRVRALAEKHCREQTALSFFCITAERHRTGISFRNTRDTFITPAVRKCSLCGRIDNGSFVSSNWKLGFVCATAGANHSCLSRMNNGATPADILGAALEKILGKSFTAKYQCLAFLLGSWLITDNRCY